MARDSNASTKNIRIEVELDELFQLPLSEFTSKRNELAAHLKKAGRREESDRVKAIPKPPASVWALNRVYHTHGQTFERLLKSGQQVREAQARQMSARDGQLRKALEDKRAALEAVVVLAAAALENGGHNASTEVLRRIAATLEALCVSHPAEARPGRLTQDLDPPGFEVLASLIPAVAPAPPPLAANAGTKKAESNTQKRDPSEANRQAAIATLQEARSVLRDASERARISSDQLEQVRRRRDELANRLERLRAEAAEMEQRVLAVEKAGEDARTAVSAAEKNVTRASREVERLQKK